LFSTVENVETKLSNVENARKNGVFTRKTVALTVEKQRRVENNLAGKAQNVVWIGFSGFSDKNGQLPARCGKVVDKKFFHVEKDVENVTKPRKIVIFRALQAENDGFSYPYLVLTYLAEHHIML